MHDMPVHRPPPGSTDEPTSEESKKKPVKRTNSFSRRKSKGKGEEQPAGGDGDGYSGDSDALQKPAFKLEAQQDPLREALQQEAGAWG